VPAGRSTLVERIDRGTGAVESFALIRGQFGVPGAAYDGSTTGLAADTGTLVLSSPANAPGAKRTQLVVLTPRLRERTRIVLRGSFAVDAVSPDGRWLYLTHYKSPTNIADYEVRAYDVARKRLLARPLVDPREPDEKMQGLPATRVMSSDGRWAYTLYGGNEKPFIHALDTVRRRAFCIDVPMLSVDASMGAQLALGSGGSLRVELDGALVALLDTSTLAVSRPFLTGPPLAETA
jgi:hypothetical protein